MPCGKKLKTSGIGRAKRFCNAKCRTAAGRSSTGDEEHGASHVQASARPHGPAPSPAPRLEVPKSSGRLVLPQVPAPRAAAAEEQLPPRVPEVLPPPGHDPTKAVVQLEALGAERARRDAEEDVIMRRGGR